MEHVSNEEELLSGASEIDLTADIVASYVAHNSVPASELPALIYSVHQALTLCARASPLTILSVLKMEKNSNPSNAICIRATT